MAGAKVIRKLKATRVYETDSCSCLETLSASREADLGVNRWRTNMLFLRVREHAAVGPRFAGGEFHFLREAVWKRSPRDGFSNVSKFGEAGGRERKGKEKKKERKVAKIENDRTWKNDSQNSQSTQIAGNNTTDIRKLTGAINDEKSLPFRVERNFSKKTVRLSGNE